MSASSVKKSTLKRPQKPPATAATARSYKSNPATPYFAAPAQQQLTSCLWPSRTTALQDRQRGGRWKIPGQSFAFPSTSAGYVGGLSAFEVVSGRRFPASRYIPEEHSWSRSYVGAERSLNASLSVGSYVHNKFNNNFTYYKLKNKYPRSLKQLLY